MIIATACFAGDIEECLRLYRWIEKLSPNLKAHDCLIVADPGTPFDRVLALKAIAKRVFRETLLEILPGETKGWPDGPNAMFQHAARFISELCPQKWLWLESDAVPTKKDWLERIDLASPDPAKFYGCIHRADLSHQPHAVPVSMSGVAVYPANAIDRLKFIPAQAWDMTNSEVMVRDGVHTDLIQHFWGEQNLPPTFVLKRDEKSPRNALEMGPMQKTALFHRNKDGTLIQLLDERLFQLENWRKIRVFFPVHNGDIAQAIRHGEWLVKLGVVHDHVATIAHDPTCNAVSLNRLQSLLRNVFKRVEVFVYPRSPLDTYPACANWAWQNCALKAAELGNPWFWLEADSCVLKPNWLELLQEEYERAGRAWMGAVVPGMFHVQGTAVYPPNTPERMPMAMRCMNEAFDMVGKTEAVDVHDSKLFFHVWSITGAGDTREACPVGGGQVPDSITAEEFKRWVPTSAVYYHRIKGNSLVDLFMNGAL